LDTYSDIDMCKSRTSMDELDASMLAWRQVEVIAETERTRLEQVRDEVFSLTEKLANVTAELELIKKRSVL
jgi:hypothetical protein